MALFQKKHICPKCQQTVQILHNDHSHAFFCDGCRYPLYWNAATKKIEADTLRSKKAHKSWADYKRKQRIKALENTASGSSCLVSLIGMALVIASIVFIF